jgi:LDH2 family malate/lactate/ureidoglycolate dehydrogenase
MDISEGESKYVKISPSDAQAFVEGVLEGNGVPKENAAIVANCLVQADLRGVDTHGMNRIPSYMARVRQGVLDPKATPSLVNVTPVVAQVSGRTPQRECGNSDNFTR